MGWHTFESLVFQGYEKKNQFLFFHKYEKSRSEIKNLIKSQKLLFISVLMCFYITFINFNKIKAEILMTTVVIMVRCFYRRDFDHYF